MKKRLAAVLLAVVAVFTFVPVASASGHAELTDIQTSKHDGFERVVLAMNGLPSGSVSSVGTEVWDCAADKRVPVAGREIVNTTHFSAATYDENFKRTYTGPRNFVPQGLTNVKGIAISCDFEATLGIAVGYENPDSWHEIRTLTNPDRVVIDIHS
ncbi:AMIN-like domain-containing (lipo)protein [Lentzea sp.]|uniref:AMIN-like domain-containing (lipo)protein n=1 Tax=Lentzea sp. TaxID=56099 RepID=UPI002C92CCD6|nr:hypothetical protein [Lentzea sp.]HUQ58675.1 hypothetical protein [Lentzea sp.]